MTAAAPPPDPTAAPGVPLAPVHDFVRKLRQGPFHARVADYVTWQKGVRAAQASGASAPPLPDWAPLSINLDLTTACNYACDHCIDWDTLNSGINHDDASLRESLATMAARGLRSVILIGGGEPTVHPRFAAMVAFLKDLGLAVAVVSNGSRNERILDVAGRLEGRDWVRLSLDAGTDATFQAMHRPKKPVSLEEICGWIPRIKARNAAPRLGFSYVICWEGSERGAHAPPVVDNVDEIPLAARLARDSGFDYISLKPFLTRTAEGAEVMDPSAARSSLERTVRRIRARVEEARALAGPQFAVLESTNLQVLERGTWRELTHQPRTCHMQALRQVLSPLGLWNCPAHRGVPKARIDGRQAYAGAQRAAATQARVGEMLGRFDASTECREVTCLYHETNWWIEQAIEDPRGLTDAALPDAGDAFL